LFVPPATAGRDAILLVHGGGWDALAKESVERIAQFFALRGHVVFNVNYRLLQHAPWPACRDDVIAAGRFALEGGLASHGAKGVERLILCGASAGGHLAMAAGLALPPARVSAIVSLAGPARLDATEHPSDAVLFIADFLRRFFGTSDVTPQMLADADVTAAVTAESPALYCIHSTNDRLVPLWHSEAAVRAWRSAGAAAELLTFDGPGNSHGFWDGDDRATRRPVPALVGLMQTVVTRINP
jgi:acetyl esterase/lipase